MKAPEVSVVVATGNNGVIGYNGKLPWSLPSDMSNFAKLTSGEDSAVIMGRKTWESLPKKPLKNRLNVVISRDPFFTAGCPHVEVFNDLELAIHLCNRSKVFIIGGSEIYKEALGLASTIFLTRVHAHTKGDTFFPELGSDWDLVESKLDVGNDSDEYYFDHLIYKKR